LNKDNVILVWFLSHIIPFLRRLGAISTSYRPSFAKVEEDPYLTICRIVLNVNKS
jgi:hypothetical protein